MALNPNMSLLTILKDRKAKARNKQLENPPDTWKLSLLNQKDGKNYLFMKDSSFN